jgi:hypothetical protein
MNSKLIIGISVVFCFVAFGRVAQLYIWPRLQVLAREDALNILVIPHMFRFAGLSFLTPGVVSPDISPAFANPAAYGDLAAAMLAVIATFALTARASWALAAVWLLNIEGAIDLLFAYYQGVIGVGLLPGALGSAFYIPTVIVPPLLVTHLMMFRLMLRSEGRISTTSVSSGVSSR